VRVSEGRKADPSAAIIDSQVVKTTPVGGPERGYNGAKRLAGRKRHILVDTGGLVLAARVHGADLPDRDGGRRLLEDGEELPRMGLVREAFGHFPHSFGRSILRSSRVGSTPRRC
jgi:putative transposase